MRSEPAMARPGARRPEHRAATPFAPVGLVTTIAAAAFACLPACSADHEPQAARAVFVSFQEALRQRDESTCRQLLTNASAAVLAEMPWDRVRTRPALQVLGARREGHEFRVQIADPEAGGKPGEFVVVREYGKLVVDLVASASLTAEVVEAAGSRDVVEPRELTPADHDRIRRHELAQPPR
jgi:hypothetical protein